MKNTKTLHAIALSMGLALALYGLESQCAGPMFMPSEAHRGTGLPGPTQFIEGVTVPLKGGGGLKGTVDLKPTLDRIKSGVSFPHRNDGSVFGNREGFLPTKPRGYYREYVHPTPGVSGPGPQRIVTGQGGEMYYTPDHYQTFIPLHR